MPCVKTLYHYCSLCTFNSIISNKSLWLSDVSKSNDSAEQKYIKNECILFLLKSQNEILKAGLEGKCNTFTSYYIDNAFDDVNDFAKKSSLNNLINSWVICFSELEDSLGQWRGYGDDGKGIAIGFNKTYLNKIFELNKGIKYKQFDLSKVRYSKKQIEKFFYEECKLNTIQNCKTYSQVTRLFNECIAKTMDNAAYFKSPSFSEEKEWRIIFKYPMFTYKKDKFSNYVKNKWFEISDFDYTVIHNKLVSHLEISFIDVTKAIDRIVIGPKNTISIDDVKHYLIDKGILGSINDKSIEIVRSNLTYR